MVSNQESDGFGILLYTSQLSDVAVENGTEDLLRWMMILVVRFRDCKEVH